MGTRRPWATSTLLILLGFLVFSGQAAVPAAGTSVMEVGAFSAEAAGDALPGQWEPFVFRNVERRTRYRLVEDAGRVVVRATAEASASGLIREVDIDPREYPIVQWRWKIVNVLRKGDVHRKAGDDCPARLYIIFARDPERLSWSEKFKDEMARLLYGTYPPSAALTYIWASRVPPGSFVPNPFSARSMMVAVRSGETDLGSWLMEERNIYADYREAFKGEPPMIAGVAIMSDTDNTGESAVAYYGDILFRKGP